MSRAVRRLRLARVISSCTYENFLSFRELFIAPYMDLRFVEESYDKELWDELFDNWGAIHEISRGHGKTEYGIHLVIYLSLARPVNQEYLRLKDYAHRMSDFLICSSDQTTTGELRDRIINYFLSDELLREYLPSDMQKREEGKKQNIEKIDLSNGCTLYFRPIKTKRGLHVDFIWVDDPTTESSTLTDKQTHDFLKGAILPMGVAKSALFWMTGTPLRNTDILSTMSSGKAFFSKKRPAVDSEGNVLSKRFNQKMLELIKKKIGSLKFSAEYLLCPIDDSVSLVKQSWIDACKDPKLVFIRNRAHYDTVIVGADFSFGDTEYGRGGGDWFAAVVLGVRGEKKYLLNIYRRNDLSAVEQLQYLKELNAVFRFDVVSLEFNSIRALAKNLIDLHLPLKLYNMGNVDEKDKKKPDFSRVISLSKRNMILRQGVQLENQLVVLPYGDEVCKEAVDLYSREVTSWALEEDKIVELGVHPDVPVAFGLALEAAGETAFIIDW